MRILRFLIEKEFRQIFRNPAILAIIIAMPLIQLLVLPLAANYEVKDIRLVLVDQDHSTFSRRLAGKLEASAYFRLSGLRDNYSQAFQEIEQDKADMIIVIPRGFERGLVSADSQPISISANAINGIKASLGTAYLNGIMMQFNEELQTELPGRGEIAELQTIAVVQSDWYNSSQSFQLFMVPGILAFLVTMITGFLSAMNIVKEKEEGTIEQVNVTPISKRHFLLGKLIPFWIIGNVVFVLGMLVSWLVYGIVPEGSIVLLFIFIWVYLLAILGFGLLVSTYCDTQQQSMLIMFFFMLVFILMSGLLTPVEQMPLWAQAVAQLNPVTHMIHVMRSVVMKGSNWQDLSRQFAVISTFAVVFNVWAVWNYKKVN